MCNDYKYLYDSCTNEKSFCLNGTKDSVEQYAACNTALINTKDTLNTFKEYKSDYSDCKQELDDCNDGRFMLVLFGAAGGAGLMYLYLKKRGTGSPSEFQEAGSLAEVAGGITSKGPANIGFKEHKKTVHKTHNAHDEPKH
jgi:hypothetical protein